VNAALNEAEELAKTPDPLVLYTAACVFARAADRPEEAGGLRSKARRHVIPL
jgi:hypothetical protein